MSAIAEHIESNDGYCTYCEDWTAFGGVEPDAHDYQCEACGHLTVVGAEEALILDLVPDADFGGEFDDDDE